MMNRSIVWERFPAGYVLSIVEGNYTEFQKRRGTASFQLLRGRLDHKAVAPLRRQLEKGFREWQQPAAQGLSCGARSIEYTASVLGAQQSRACRRCPDGRRSAWPRAPAGSRSGAPLGCGQSGRGSASAAAMARCEKPRPQVDSGSDREGSPLARAIAFSAPSRPPQRRSRAAGASDRAQPSAVRQSMRPGEG